MSSSKVGTILQSHGLCFPKAVHPPLNICSHHSSLCFFFFHCPHLSGIHLLSSSTHSSFLNSLLASASAPPQSGVHTWDKASFIQCRSDQVAPPLLCCSGLAGQSKMTLMTLPVLAASYTRSCHFSPAPSPPLLPTLCSAMLKLNNHAVLVLKSAIHSHVLSSRLASPNVWPVTASQYPCSKFVVSRFSRVKLFATPWTVAHQVPLSMEFSRQEYWSGLPFPSPGDLPKPGTEQCLLHCRQILYHLSHRETQGVNTPINQLITGLLNAHS